MNKIALGTVQFGLNYGISNAVGQVAPEVVAEILVHAREVGVDVLDTAVSYGNSESVLGDALQTNRLSFHIVSKYPPDTTAVQFPTILQNSLERLRVPRLKAYLAHDFKSFQNEVLRAKVAEAKSQKLIEQVGVSVYFPQDIEWLLENNIAFDIVQLPFNVLDRRFDYLFPELKNRGVEINGRSIFLQGLLLMPPEQIRPYFTPIQPILVHLHRLSQDHHIPLNALLLNHAVAHSAIDKVVIGVTSLTELQQNLAALHYANNCLPLHPVLDTFAFSDENILLPFRWK